MPQTYDYLIAPKASFDATADAIRALNGSQASITWGQDGFADAIGSDRRYTADGIATNTEPSGVVILSDSTTSIDTYAFKNKSGITSISGNNIASIGHYAFADCTGLASINFPVCPTIGNYCFQNCSNLVATGLPYFTGSAQDAWNGCSKLEYFVHNVTGVYTRMLRNCSSLKAVDVGPRWANARADMCNGCSVLTVFVIRNDQSVVALPNISAFANTPFASGGTGGTLYVPESLVSGYTSASNWSTILAYTNNQIKSIESTHTDPNAPIDLTLYYADGTLIPTGGES